MICKQAHSLKDPSLTIWPYEVRCDKIEVVAKSIRVSDISYNMKLYEVRAFGTPVKSEFLLFLAAHGKVPFPAQKIGVFWIALASNGMCYFGYSTYSTIPYNMVSKTGV